MLNLIYITCKDEAEAQKIAEELLEQKLIACANILPAVTSMYFWQGELQQDQEVVLILKTKAEKFTAIQEKVTKLHSYDCPCVISLGIQDVNKAFGAYIENSLLN